jgi:hypothetical protein
MHASVVAGAEKVPIRIEQRRADGDPALGKTGFRFANGHFEERMRIEHA